MTSSSPACSSIAVCPGRVNLPIAGMLNAKAMFGAPTRAQLAKASVPPAEACNLLQMAKDQAAFRGERLQTVGVTGPGEPLATPEAILDALETLHAAEPELQLVLRTNGLGAAELAPRLAAAGVGWVVLDVDAVDPDLVRRLYAWIRPGKKTLPMGQAAELFIAEQEKALVACKEQGLKVTVRTTVFPGVNDGHVEQMARRMAQLGADELQLQGWEPSQEQEEPGQEALADNLPPATSPALLTTVRELAARHLPLCDDSDAASAPALGITLGESPPAPGIAGMPVPSKERPNVAVATESGFEVDMHLGQSRQFLIYGAPEGLASLIEVRTAPASGKGDARWQELAATLSDCSYLLVSHAGENPERVLGQEGLRLLRTQGDIEAIVDCLYGGGKKGKCKK